MNYTFTIKGRLLGLNEYIEAERRNRFQAAKLKHDYESMIILQAKKQLRKMPPLHYPIIMHYTWIEESKRRDKSNIAAYGRKLIEDALQKGGFIDGDGWKHVAGFTDSFDVDKTNPRIIVTIEEAET